ncbi:fimbrial protein [Salmonella enterica]|nr:hypothetical protein [Salmonella enterica]EFQ6618138.1 fimbrial protein [Salmonella enterica]
MINRLLRARMLTALMLASCGSMLLYTRPASAALECFFNSTGTVTVGGNISQETVTLKQGGGWLTSEISLGQSRTTSCNAGGGGQNLYSWRGSISPAFTLDVEGSQNGGDGDKKPRYRAAFFATNVPGIYYTVEIMKGGKVAPYGYIADSTSQTETGYIDDGVDGATLDGSTTHNFYILLYQDPGYVSNGVSVSAIRPATTGVVGYFRYGTQDSPVNVQVNDFSIPVKIPGCNAALSSQNASGSTVNMGTTTPADIKNGDTKPVPFAISLTGCANASQAVVKLTSDQYDSSTGYLKNTGTDMGAGVKITGADSGTQLKPGGSAANWSVSGSSASLLMNAQLMKLSDTPSTGKFSAQGTFEITYN